MELAFIQTTRTDEGRGLNGTLCRGELLDVILRLAKALYLQRKDLHLEAHVYEMMFKYIIPVYKDSRILKDREIIRKCKEVNQLLYHNATGLRMIYTEKKIWRKGQ